MGVSTDYKISVRTPDSDPISVAVGDFNEDGNSDLAFANYLSSDISILLGTGTGSFGAATNIAAGSLPVSVTVVQFDTGPENNIILHPIKDSFLRKKYPDTNEGANQELHIRKTGDEVKRTLIAFDEGVISEAAAGRTLQSAKLRLYITDNNDQWGNGRQVDIYQLLENWTEGNGFNAKPSDMSDSDFALKTFRESGHGVTWNSAIDPNINNKFRDAEFWDGGNHYSAPTDSLIIQNGQENIWIDFDVIADVREFIDGSSENFGWIIKKLNEDELGTVNFGSRETTGLNQPELVLEFSAAQ